jgi:metal-responsive CopG/Arc/MetJ family transcriptional regulator
VIDPTATRRVHVVIANDLIEEIDARCGARQRSQFIQEAVAEKLRAMRLTASIAGMAGPLADGDSQVWETPEAAAG